MAMTPEDERVLRDLASTPKFQAHYRRNDNLWLEGKKRDRPPLNCADADEANRMKIQVLRRHGSAIPAAMRLANVLECRPYAINAASPVFMRAFQRHLTQHLHVACERIGGSLSIVSAVHPRARVPIDGLHPDIFQGLERHLHRALHAAGIEYAVGGFDLSANEHESGDFKPHYQAQAWVLAKTSEVRGGERVLRSWFPTSDTVFRPCGSKTGMAIPAPSPMRSSRTSIAV